MRARVAVFVACLGWAQVLHPGVAGAKQLTGDLAGRVVDAKDRPVVDARVLLVGLAATTTDSSGRFAFSGLETETLLLRVEKQGYALATRSVVFWADSGLREVVVRLGTRSTVLAAVTVLDSAVDDPRNYIRRRQLGAGFYLTQAEIRKRGPTPRVENILGTLPGLRLDGGVVKVARGRISILGNNCEDGVQYWVDGAMTGPAFSPRFIAPESLTGIEVYKSASETPLEYRSMKTSCGTVVLWTY